MNILDFDPQIINQKYSIPPGHRHRTVFRDRHNGVIYFHTHKNASKTLRRVMFSSSKPMYHHRDYYELLELESHLKQYKTFWVIREPVDRFVSAFCEIGHIRSLGCPNEITSSQVDWKQKITEDKHNIDEAFISFVEDAHTHYYNKEAFPHWKGYSDKHIYPQILTLTHKNLKPSSVDRVILFENMREEMTSFVDDNNIVDWEMELLRKKEGKTNNFLKQYICEMIDNNTNLKNKIESLYPEDIQIYKSIIAARKSREHDYL